MYNKLSIVYHYYKLGKKFNIIGVVWCSG